VALVAVLAGATAAVTSRVTSGMSAASAVGENLASNPVLAVDAQGWGVLSGGSGARVAAGGHPSADFAYGVTVNGSAAGIYLPQLAVAGGTKYTIAVDTRTPGSAHLQMDWYGPTVSWGRRRARR
jgi:hypothetical protein